MRSAELIAGRIRGQKHRYCSLRVQCPIRIRPKAHGARLGLPSTLVRIHSCGSALARQSWPYRHSHHRVGIIGIFSSHYERLNRRGFSMDLMPQEHEVFYRIQHFLKSQKADFPLNPTDSTPQSA